MQLDTKASSVRWPNSARDQGYDGTGMSISILHSAIARQASGWERLLADAIVPGDVLARGESGRPGVFPCGEVCLPVEP